MYSDISKDRRCTGARNKLVLLGSSFPASFNEVCYSALMLEAVVSSETLVCIYKTNWRDVPEDSNRHCNSNSLEILTSQLKNKSNCPEKQVVLQHSQQPNCIPSNVDVTDGLWIETDLDTSERYLIEKISSNFPGGSKE
jgi:hypothetical protein